MHISSLFLVFVVYADRLSFEIHGFQIVPRTVNFRLISVADTAGACLVQLHQLWFPKLEKRNKPCCWYKEDVKPIHGLICQVRALALVSLSSINT